MTEFVLNAPQPTLSAAALRAGVAELLMHFGATNFSIAVVTG